MEGSFPWHWVELIGVHSRQTYQHVMNILKMAQYRPPVTIEPAWYY
ncbi:DarT ssDNA thymidine ADP-ribosyltransferase family protein [Nitrosomonas nitrosa]